MIPETFLGDALHYNVNVTHTLHATKMNNINSVQSSST